MKRILRLSVALIALSLGSTQVSQAAFPIKHEAKVVVTEQAAAPAAEMTLATPEAAASALGQVSTVKKQNFFTRTLNTVKKGGSAMPQVLYIILAIIGLGWLAMGINDSFSDFDWLISLVLYILFYIPGLIYTLIKMNKYY
jgi:uncharacterized membrane protein YqaE (UPF0057 family)